MPPSQGVSLAQTLYETNPSSQQARARKQTLSLLLIQRKHGIDVTSSAHNDGTAIMNVLGNDLHDASDFALEHTRGGDTTGLLRDHSHREALVEHAQLAFGRLLVRRVQEDASVQERTMYVRNHGSDIARCISIILARLDEVNDGLIPLQRIPFVARENLLATLWISDDELSCSSIHTIAGCYHLRP